MVEFWLGSMVRLAGCVLPLRVTYFVRRSERVDVYPARGLVRRHQVLTGTWVEREEAFLSTTLQGIRRLRLAGQ
jgi:hypothetical protein